MKQFDIPESGIRRISKIILQALNTLNTLSSTSNPYNTPHLLPMADTEFEIEIPNNLYDFDDETRIGLALAAYRKSQARTNISDRDKLSLRKCAKLFDVSRSTLTDRFNGIKPRRQAHEHQQNLTAVQEDVLAAWAKSLGRRGVPLTPAAIADYATEICGFSVGVNWPHRFIERHPELKTRWTQSMEKCRATAVNYTNVQGVYFLIQIQIQISSFANNIDYTFVYHSRLLRHL